MKENAAKKAKVKVVKEVTEKKTAHARAVKPSVPIDKKRFKLLLEHTGVEIETVANCWGCTATSARMKVAKGLLKPGEAFILAALCYLPLEMKKMLAVKVSSLGKPAKAIVQFVDDDDESTEAAPTSQGAEEESEEADDVDDDDDDYEDDV